MKANIRSISGAALMLVIIPMFAGLLACMPVPVGNPERSRIDPDVSGAWVLDSEEDNPELYLFQPYDKRTWFVASVLIDEGKDFAGDPLEIKTAGDVIAALERHPVDDTGITAKRVSLYKAWLTRLGGEMIMTWEPLGGLDDEAGFTPEFWWVFKFVKDDRDRFFLHIVNVEHDAFDGIVRPKDYDGDDYVGDMQRQWERALKKHIDDDDMFAPPATARRIPNSLVDEVSKLFKQVIDVD